MSAGAVRTRYKIDCHQDALMTMPAKLIIEGKDDEIAVGVSWENTHDKETYTCFVTAEYKRWNEVLAAITTNKKWADKTNILVAMPHADNYYRLTFYIDDLLGMVFISDAELLDLRDIFIAIEAQRYRTGKRSETNVEPVLVQAEADKSVQKPSPPKEWDFPGVF